jgi:hypothetical protein
VGGRASRLYRFFAKHWNAFLSAISLVGVAIFSVVAPLQQYVSVFVFLAANAVVWTLIEIKHDLDSKVSDVTFHANMRLARPHILTDIDKALKGTTRQKPLQLKLLGGRIRSMSDAIRELSDDLRSGRGSGHVSIDLYCIDPIYIRSRVVHDGVSQKGQATRNASYASIIENVSEELRGLASISHASSTLAIRIVHYRGDPHIYAYLIGDRSLYWGTYTWSETEADFVGPENPCVRVDRRDKEYIQLLPWIESRMRLYEIESAVQRASDSSNA